MKIKLVMLMGTLALLFASACSTNQIAMRSSNPEFIGTFIPDVIEKNEKKLAKKPDDMPLILETGSLYVMYANAFVQGPAEMRPVSQYEEKEAQKAEAKRLYLRGAAILNDGLDKKYPGFAAAFQKGDVSALLLPMESADVPFLYWHVAGTLSAFSLDPFDLDLGQKIPVLKTMIDRAYELSPDFNSGALDDFYVLFYASMPESMGGDKTQVERHFKLAVEKSRGLLAGPYVSYAQAVLVPAQDYAAFKENLEKALAIDPNKDKDNRLVNTLSQRKARYLLDNASAFFFELGDDTDWGDDWDDEYDDDTFGEEE
jgi:predicted anti-sigma-YlaC factor YlaD